LLSGQVTVVDLLVLDRVRSWQAVGSHWLSCRSTRSAVAGLEVGDAFPGLWQRTSSIVNSSI